jgi:predicted GNAT family acetyltransferase
MVIEVHDVPAEKHFAAVVDGAAAGKGVGSALARAALDQARAWELPVLPLCPFIKGYIERHREYVDVVYRTPRTTAVD